MVCTLATLAPTGGSPAQIKITGTLAEGIGGRTIADAATVSSDTSDPDLSNNTATLSQLVGPAADLTITKRALLSDGETLVTNPLAVGEPFIYALRVTNNGPSEATSTVVTDTLPAGITLASSAPAGCTPKSPGSGGTITCTIGKLPAGESAIINLPVVAGPSAANTAPQNTASVSSATPDPNPAGATSSTTTVGIGRVANLALAKSVSPQTANVGELVTYSLAVTNNVSVGEEGGRKSELGTTGGVVSDTLPAGLQFVASAAGSSCNPGPPDTVTCNVGPVAQGENVSAAFTARVTPAAAGASLDNTATVATAAAGGFPALPDFEPGDNTAHASLTVNPLADVSLTKTVSNANPAVDDEVDYTLTASNAGPDEATGVTIHDSLPAGLDFIDASPGCDNDNGTVTCDVGTLASGETAAVTIRASTTAVVSGIVDQQLGVRDGQRARSKPRKQPGERDDHRPTVLRSQTGKDGVESLADGGGPGHLHAGADQQRTEPRDWGNDHRSAPQWALVLIGECRAGQLWCYWADCHLPARDARRRQRCDRDGHRERRSVGGRQHTHQHSQRIGKRTGQAARADRPARATELAGVDHSRRGALDTNVPALDSTAGGDWC